MGGIAVVNTIPRVQLVTPGTIPTPVDPFSSILTLLLRTIQGADLVPVRVKREGMIWPGCLSINFVPYIDVLTGETFSFCIIPLTSENAACDLGVFGKNPNYPRLGFGEQLRLGPLVFLQGTTVQETSEQSFH